MIRQEHFIFPHVQKDDPKILGKITMIHYYHYLEHLILIGNRHLYLAIKLLPTGLKHWYAKFSSGHIGHNHCLFKKKQCIVLKCPVCRTKEEKSSQVLICNNEQSKMNFSISLKKNLTPTLGCTNTAPALSKVIQDILKSGEKQIY